MVRTRDFILGLLIVAFLLLATGLTHMRTIVTSIGSVAGMSWLDGGASVEYTAEVPVLPDTRADKLEHLRQKIAERLSLSAPEDIPPPAVVTAVATTSTPTTATSTTVVVVDECAGYAPLVIDWYSQNITQENREGMRVYAEMGPETIDALGASVSTEYVRVKFPLRFWPLSNSSCLLHDVIGIATDGSLMRNSEVPTYAVFGASTLIGYSLDGFPIYGASPRVTVDACGGAIVEGSYRYVVDAKRPGIILCYAGAPASIL
jgi:hypothetical protein